MIMKRQKETPKEVKKDYKSKNLKNGNFKENELNIYDTKMTDSEIILKYQTVFPTLQQDNNIWIDARCLWTELGVGRDYTDWIKQQIDDIGLEKDIDYFTTPFQKGIANTKGFKEILQYMITVSTAKEVAMVAGAKGGRTSKELKEKSRLVRKYFIAIESAYKNRETWNDDRKDTLINCKELQYAMLKYHKQLFETKPEWSHSVQKAEFCMFNNIVIGMCASEYKKLCGLGKRESIRNTFTEQQLEYVAELEKYDADLIMVQNIFDYEERYEILEKKYKLMD